MSTMPTLISVFWEHELRSIKGKPYMREGAVIRLSKPAFRCRAIFTEFYLKFLGFMRSGEKEVFFGRIY